MWALFFSFRFHMKSLEQGRCYCIQVQSVVNALSVNNI